MSWHPNKRGKGWLMFDREYSSKRNLRPKRVFANIKDKQQAIMTIMARGVPYFNFKPTQKESRYNLRSVYGSKY